MRSKVTKPNTSGLKGELSDEGWELAVGEETMTVVTTITGALGEGVGLDRDAGTTSEGVKTGASEVRITSPRTVKGPLPSRNVTT